MKIGDIRTWWVRQIRSRLPFSRKLRQVVQGLPVQRGDDTDPVSQMNPKDPLMLIARIDSEMHQLLRDLPPETPEESRKAVEEAIESWRGTGLYDYRSYEEQTEQRGNVAQAYPDGWNVVHDIIAEQQVERLLHLRRQTPDSQYLLELARLLQATLNARAHVAHLGVQFNEWTTFVGGVRQGSSPDINLLDVGEDEDAVKAAGAVAAGLDALFRRLGPPPPHLRAESEPLLSGGGGAAG